SRTDRHYGAHRGGGEVSDVDDAADATLAGGKHPGEHAHRRLLEQPDERRGCERIEPGVSIPVGGEGSLYALDHNPFLTDAGLVTRHQRHLRWRSGRVSPPPPAAVPATRGRREPTAPRPGRRSSPLRHRPPLRLQSREGSLSSPGGPCGRPRYSG